MALLSLEEQTDRYQRSLRAVPVRNTEARATPGPGPAELTVEVRLRYGPVLGLFRRLLKARTAKTYVLDAVGREVYEDIDGTRDFETLIDRFAARHRLTFLESRALLAQYLQILTRRGIVVATLSRSAAPVPRSLEADAHRYRLDQGHAPGRLRAAVEEGN